MGLFNRKNRWEKEVERLEGTDHLSPEEYEIQKRLHRKRKGILSRVVGVLGNFAVAGAALLGGSAQAQEVPEEPTPIVQVDDTPELTTPEPVMIAQADPSSDNVVPTPVIQEGNDDDIDNIPNVQEPVDFASSIENETIKTHNSGEYSESDNTYTVSNELQDRLDQLEDGESIRVRIITESDDLNVRDSQGNRLYDLDNGSLVNIYNDVIKLGLSDRSGNITVSDYVRIGDDRYIMIGYFTENLDQIDGLYEPEDEPTSIRRSRPQEPVEEEMEVQINEPAEPDEQADEAAELTPEEEFTEYYRQENDRITNERMEAQTEANENSSNLAEYQDLLERIQNLQELGREEFSIIMNELLTQEELLEEELGDLGLIGRQANQRREEIRTRIEEIDSSQELLSRNFYILDNSRLTYFKLVIADAIQWASINSSLLERKQDLLRLEYRLLRLERHLFNTHQSDEPEDRIPRLDEAITELEAEQAGLRDSIEDLSGYLESTRVPNNDQIDEINEEVRALESTHEHSASTPSINSSSEDEHKNGTKTSFEERYADLINQDAIYTATSGREIPVSIIGFSQHENGGLILRDISTNRQFAVSTNRLLDENDQLNLEILLPSF